MAEKSIPQPVPALIQHKYLRPVGGGPCIECGRPTEEHEPLPRFVSITRREEESLKAGLPAWMVPLWDGIHAWAANLRTGSLKKHCEGLAKRVERIPDQAEASAFLSVVVERAIAAERARISREPAAGLDAHVRFGKELAGCVVDCYVDAAGAEWVPLSQARDAAERRVQHLAEELRDLKAEKEGREDDLQFEGAERDDEVARLAEEVERLKKEHEALKGGCRAWKKETVDRIRRGLLAELAASKVEGVPGAWYLRERDFLASVDRIVPGEG